MEIKMTPKVMANEMEVVQSISPVYNGLYIVV